MGELSGFCKRVRILVIMKILMKLSQRFWGTRAFTSEEQGVKASKMWVIGEQRQYGGTKQRHVYFREQENGSSLIWGSAEQLLHGIEKDVLPWQVTGK